MHLVRGQPEGTREERQNGLWTETLRWGWTFKGDDAWLVVTIDKGKHFTEGELRYNAGKGNYQLTLTTHDKATATFAGTLKDKVLTLDRTDGGAPEDQRLVFSLLHFNPHPISLISKLALGATYGVIAWRTKGLVAPAVTHALVWWVIGAS